MLSVTVVGRVYRAPERRKTSKGVGYTVVAVRCYTPPADGGSTQGEQQTDATWVRVSLFGGRGEWAAQLRVGDDIVVTGTATVAPVRDGNRYSALYVRGGAIERTSPASGGPREQA